MQIDWPQNKASPLIFGCFTVIRPTHHFEDYKRANVGKAVYCNGWQMVKSETRRDWHLKIRGRDKKCSDLIEKQICDRQAQNLRLRDLLVGFARFRDLGRTCRHFSFFRGPFTTPTVILSTLQNIYPVFIKHSVLKQTMSRCFSKFPRT